MGWAERPQVFDETTAAMECMLPTICMCRKISRALVPCNVVPMKYVILSLMIPEQNTSCACVFLRLAVIPGVLHIAFSSLEHVRPERVKCVVSLRQRDCCSETLSIVRRDRYTFLSSTLRTSPSVPASLQRCSLSIAVRFSSFDNNHSIQPVSVD